MSQNEVIGDVYGNEDSYFSLLAYYAMFESIS
jgi:hypothetical protein